MAIQQLTLPGDIVKKHNDLVRSKINISSKTAARIIACLVAAVRHDDTQFKSAYTVPIMEYLPQDDSGSGNSYKLARAACKELVAATVEREWPDPDDPTGHPIFCAMPFFLSVKYRKGTVKAEFNPRLAPLLLQLHSFFTQYNLLEYLALPSLYSQRLFEILKSWSRLPEVVLPVAELHNLLDTPDSFRADFRNFRLRVLEKAHKDIQEKTSLRYDWTPIKKGRAVESIKFSFGNRRAIVQQKQEDQEKKSRLNTQRFTRAVNCSKSKSGHCIRQDNKPIICKLCMAFNICAEIRQKQSN